MVVGLVMARRLKAFSLRPITVVGTGIPPLFLGYLGDPCLVM